MKKFIISLLIVAAFVAIPVSVFAQVEDMAANVDASARIITPISITQTSGTELNFGTMTTPSVETVVSISTSAGRNIESGSTTLVTSGGVNTTPSVPEFVVTGEVDATYAITFSSPVSLSSGSNSMSVTAFTEDATNTLVSGTETFKVGASLTIGANQPNGTYTGIFDVTVAYN